MDLLSDALNIIRLTGALLFRVNVIGPWCISSAPGADEFTRYLPTGTDQTIAFHLVVEGKCWFRRPPGDWHLAGSGEAVVLPYADTHELGAERQPTPVNFTEILGNQSLIDLRNLEFETGAGPHTKLLCGFLGCDRRAFAPLFAALPRMFFTELNNNAMGLVRYALEESLRNEPGTASLRTRTAELLFLETLKDHIQNLPEHSTGWLAGLRDPIVGRTLQLMHEAPATPWTVETIADRVAVSRSLLAERFKSVMGESPMHYLTELRMQRAARRLSDSRASVAAIAEEVGYGSPAAFQRAFKRSFGVPPAAWRREVRQQRFD